MPGRVSIQYESPQGTVTSTIQRDLTPRQWHGYIYYAVQHMHLLPGFVSSVIGNPDATDQQIADEVQELGDKLVIRVARMVRDAARAGFDEGYMEQIIAERDSQIGADVVEPEPEYVAPPEG